MDTALPHGSSGDLGLSFATADVFTDRRFAGNRVAVIFDAWPLTTADMQAVAAEFGYPETVFLTTPGGRSGSVGARIFTPKAEVPFAGHPLVGAAYLLAHRAHTGGQQDVVFDVAAGPVVATPLIDDGLVCGAELRAPSPLERRSELDVSTAARLLGLMPHQVEMGRHPPTIITVGLPILAVHVGADALNTIVPNPAAHLATFPLDGADSVYAYALDEDGGSAAGEARMFSLLDGIGEDPATGSAAAALGAFLLSLEHEDARALVLRQGSFIGRPSRLQVNARRLGSGFEATVGGRCRSVLEGRLAVGR